MSGLMYNLFAQSLRLPKSSAIGLCSQATTSESINLPSQITSSGCRVPFSPLSTTVNTIGVWNNDGHARAKQTSPFSLMFFPNEGSKLVSGTQAFTEIIEPMPQGLLLYSLVCQRCNLQFSRSPQSQVPWPLSALPALQCLCQNLTLVRLPIWTAS